MVKVLASKGYKVVEFHIKGVAELIVHNGQTSDPLNEYSKKLKKVSGKRTKTDDDHEEMAAIEWEAGIYLDGARQPIIPGVNIESMLIAAAKKVKRGPDAKAGIIVPTDSIIEHDGPKDIQTLKKDPRFYDRRSVRVQQARVMRTRPKFPVWEMKISVQYLPGIFNEEEIKEIMVIAGIQIGMGDFRPRFGRFEVLNK